MSGSDQPIGKQRPYLLRAMHEWMTDNGLTPHIVIDANREGLALPREHVKDGKLVLNVSYTATRDLDISNEAATFEARFGGVARRLAIPIDAIMGIYARENGQGMVFSEEPRPDASPDNGQTADTRAADAAKPKEPEPKDSAKSKRSRLRVVK